VQPVGIGQVGRADRLVSLACGTMAVRTMLYKKITTTGDFTLTAKHQPLLVERNDMVDEIVNLIAG